VIADAGMRPRWNAEGMRLAVQEEHPDEADAAVIRVYVFALRRERSDSASTIDEEGE